MAGYSDSDLVEGFLNGEKKAFEELYDRYYSTIVRFCFSITRNMEDAKDITLSALTILFKKHKDFNSLTHIRAFLYLTAKHRCLDQLKSTQRLAERYKKYFEGKVHDPESTFIDQVDGELFRVLYKSIQQLPPQSRNVIKLLYLDEMKYQEVADVLQLTVKNVYNMRNYALKKLRESLSSLSLLSLLYSILLSFFA